YRPTWCTITCYRAINGGVFSQEDVQPLSSAIMSYYFACMGPYVLNGKKSEGFSPDSVERIQFCRHNAPERATLPNACSGRGLDTDQDGLCGDEDSGGLVADTRQLDTDQDGTPDSCDSCPYASGGSIDTDSDGT